MTAAYLVIYEGMPHDPDEWVRYYLEEHLPLVWRFPELLGVEIHLGRDEEEVFMMTRLLFEDVDTLRAAITSPERLAARRDMDEQLLPRFAGTVRHQTTELLAFSPPQ